MKTAIQMKNIHILPTDKPSRLYYWEDKLVLGNLATTPMNRNIYITNDEEIKKGDFFYSIRGFIEKAIINYPKGEHFGKLILTTDQELIKDGVQAIDDEFLQWFVKNPSCEFVEVQMNQGRYFDYGGNVHITNAYKIIIPKEEPKKYKVMIVGDGLPKQETLEEAAENESEYLADYDDKEMYQKGFIEGAKWQQEQDKNKYSLDDLKEAFAMGRTNATIKDFNIKFKNK